MGHWTVDTVHWTGALVQGGRIRRMRVSLRLAITAQQQLLPAAYPHPPHLPITLSLSLSSDVGGHVRLSFTAVNKRLNFNCADLNQKNLYFGEVSGNHVHSAHLGLHYRFALRM